MFEGVITAGGVIGLLVFGTPPALVPNEYDMVHHTFTMPDVACEAPDCTQTLVQVEDDSKACQFYENLGLANFDAPNVKMRPEQAPGKTRFVAMGDARGKSFEFIAHVSRRTGCTPTS